MTKNKLNVDELIEEYVQNVTSFNQEMEAYQLTIKEKYKNLSTEELLEEIKKVFDEETDYRGIYDKRNDYNLFLQELRQNIVITFFKDNEDVKHFIEAKENIMNNKATTDQKERQMSALSRRINVFYTQHENKIDKDDEISNYKRDYCLDTLAKRQTDVYNRMRVQQILNENKSPNEIFCFDAKFDKGSCTKSITLYLYQLQEKYGINIFNNLSNIEDIAHPNQLVQTLSKYVKKSETTGCIKDMEGGIKKGDIVLIKRDTGELGHAMMCYGFNEKNEPLLLGFSGNKNYGVNAYYSKEGPRKGIVIDVNDLISDAVNQKENPQILSNTKDKER